MMIFLVLNSLIVGILTIYTLYQIDKKQTPVLRGKNGEFIKILSPESPLLVKFIILSSFIPVINFFHVLLFILDLL